jgi:hypothetical protein
MISSLWEKVATVTFTLRNTGKLDGTEVRRKDLIHPDYWTQWYWLDSSTLHQLSCWLQRTTTSIAWFREHLP